MYSEKDIKAKVLSRMINNGSINSDSLVVSEMSLAGKARRVDLAVLHGTKLVAIEIKSEKDTLTRLSGQLEEYAKYFDKVLVVAAEKFIASITSIVGDDVEVWSVSTSGLKVVKRGRVVRDICKLSYLELMTRREMLLAAKAAGLRVNSLPMYDLKNAVLESIDKISKKELKNILIDGMYSRFSRTSSRFLTKALATESVTHDDVSLLSPLYRPSMQDYVMYH